MIKNLLSNDEPDVPTEDKSTKHRGSDAILTNLFDSESNDPPAAPYQNEPETLAETARRSGLAWSAGVVFFSAILFMLIIGWGADLLLGTSPWGLVGGIVLGSIIGFVQFFRITSQIFKK